MDKIKQAYIDGFIKAAGKSSSLERLIAQLRRAESAKVPDEYEIDRLSNLIENHPNNVPDDISDYTHLGSKPSAGQPKLPQLPQASSAPKIMPGNSGLPQDQHILQAARLNRQEAAQQARYHTLDPANDVENIMGKDRTAGRDAAASKFIPPASQGTALYRQPVQPQGQSAISETIKKLFGITPDGKFNLSREHLNNGMPIGQAAAIGTGVGLTAHYGGQAAGNLSVPNNPIQLSNPAGAANAHAARIFQENEGQGFTHNFSNAYYNLMDKLKAHPYLAGGAAAGLGGLGAAGYYLHGHRPAKHTGATEEPGGAEDLE